MADVIDNRTQSRNYALPDQSNKLRDDVVRLIEALSQIDGDVGALIAAVLGKAPLEHEHQIEHIVGLVTALQGKAASDHSHQLGALQGVDLQQAANGMFFKLVGGVWVPAQIAAGDIRSGTIEDARFPSHLQAANVQAIIAGLAGKLDVAGGAIAGNLAVGGEFTYGKAKAISGADLDALTTPGFYDGSNLANGPTGAGSSTWYFVQVQRHSNPGLYVEQIATALNHSNGASWKRLCVNGAWQTWRQMWDAQTFDPASKLNMSGGNLTGTLLAIDRLTARAAANGNAHVWLQDPAGNNRALFYWDRNTGDAHLRVYVDDGNGTAVPAGTISLRANGTVDINGNTIWHAGHKATAAQFRAGTANTVLTSDGVWAAAGYVGLSAAAGSTLAAGTYAPNFGAGLNFHNVLGGNVTIGNPTNAKAGQTGLIVLQQDVTGGRTVAFGSAWRFANGNAPSMNTAASRTNVVAYQVLHSGFVIGSSIAGLV